MTENAVSTNTSDSSPQGVLLSLRAEIADLSNRLQAALKALADLVSGNQVSAEDFDAIKAPESTETPSKTPKPTASALVEPLTKSAECPAVPVKPVDVRDHSARRVAKGPLDGDPGLGDLPERMVTDMSKGLPYTFTPQDLHDARLIRMMARCVHV